MKFVFLSFLILLIFLFTIEGFEVNDYRYEVCSNKILKNSGLKHMLNNYNIVKNDIKPLPTWTVSAVINASGVRNKHRLYTPPICKNGKNFSDNYFINNQITDVNNERDRLPLFDPYYLEGTYGKSEKILYDDNEIIHFTDVHKENEKEVLHRKQKIDLLEKQIDEE